MKRGDYTPIAPVPDAETDKNAPCEKVSVKLVIINKLTRICLVLFQISPHILTTGKKSRNGTSFFTRNLWPGHSRNNAMLSTPHLANSRCRVSRPCRVPCDRACPERSRQDGDFSPIFRCYRKFIANIRGSVISSIAYFNPSRPSPESFTPPYGI